MKLTSVVMDPRSLRKAKAGHPLFSSNVSGKAILHGPQSKKIGFFVAPHQYHPRHAIVSLSTDRHTVPSSLCPSPQSQPR